MQVPGSGFLQALAVFALDGTQSISNGGNGYTVGDILTLDDGDLARPSASTGKVRVLTAPGGHVGSVAISNTGAYRKRASGTVTGGTGTGAVIIPNWKLMAPGYAGASTYTLTAAIADGGNTIDYGMQPGYGAIAPADLAGATILSLYDQHAGVLVPPASWNLSFVLSQVVAQNFFTSIQCGDVTLNSADATLFTTAGGISIWYFDPIAAPMFTSSGDYSVTIT